MYLLVGSCVIFFFFFQAEDGIRDRTVTGVQTCALPISSTNQNRITGKIGWKESPQETYGTLTNSHLLQRPTAAKQESRPFALTTPMANPQRLSTTKAKANYYTRSSSTHHQRISEWSPTTHTQSPLSTLKK